MSSRAKYLAALEADRYYHIYNRTNNRELLFRSDDNYAYFLHLYNQFIRPFCKTYSWCLLPNHFHFLLQAQPLQVLLEQVSATSSTSLIPSLLSGDTLSAHRIISAAFKRLFTAYAMAFNKAWQRRGNLFHRPFKRLVVENGQDLIDAAIYLHTNPKHHGITTSFEDYRWSSYGAILGEAQLPEAASLLTQFGGADGFITAHRERADSLRLLPIDDW